MPQIGRIDVPNDLWEEMVRCRALEIASDALGHIDRFYLVIDAIEKWDQLDPDLDTRRASANNRLIALVQRQMGDNPVGRAGSDANNESDHLRCLIQYCSPEVCYQPKAKSIQGTGFSLFVAPILRHFLCIIS
jgi:hypothetical protein